MDAECTVSCIYHPSTTKHTSFLMWTEAGKGAFWDVLTHQTWVKRPSCQLWQQLTYCEKCVDRSYFCSQRVQPRQSRPCLPLFLWQFFCPHLFMNLAIFAALEQDDIQTIIQTMKSFPEMAAVLLCSVNSDTVNRRSISRSMWDSK